MSLKVGIVGLPNVGKSTLFNALLKKRVALSANYPFATVEPNVGVVAVPDERLQKLAEVVKTEEKMDSLPPIVPAAVEFVDIAGLVKGAHEGEGLGNQFLSHIREVDAIAHVIRDFQDENVIRSGSTEPISDKEIIETELALADMQTIENSNVKAQRLGKAHFLSGRAKGKVEDQNLETALTKLTESLNKGISAREAGLSDEEKESLPFPLLTMKPVIYVYNVDESVIASEAKQSTLGKSPEKIAASANWRTRNDIKICAKLEEELADLNKVEREQYLKEIGIEEAGLDRLIRKAYDLLELISFFTAGRKEVRAWTVKKGTKAPQAAGVIHTDFEKGFIRVAVINWKSFVEIGGWKKAVEAGKIAMHGKDYLIQDGEVVYYRVIKN